jgi:hypothetical protein
MESNATSENLIHILERNPKNFDLWISNVKHYVATQNQLTGHFIKQKEFLSAHAVVFQMKNVLDLCSTNDVLCAFQQLEKNLRSWNDESELEKAHQNFCQTWKLFEDLF